MDLRSSLTSHHEEMMALTRGFFAQQQQEAAEIEPLLERSVTLLADFCERGGKSIRSYLARLSYELCGGTITPEILKAFAAIELHHKHILILDDIADRDEKRYGGPTMEYAYRDVFAKKRAADHWARSYAMLDATLLSTFARELLLQSKAPPSRLNIVMHILDTTMYRDTLAGWQIHSDQTFSPIAMATPERFIKGLEYVTASYTFQGPLAIGCVLAGNSDPTIQQQLDIYAKYVGTAFQMRDDELGLFGESDKTGKPVGNDVREGKKTLLIQYAYQAATPEDQQFLEACVGNTTLSADEIQRVQAIVQQTGAYDQSHALAVEYSQQGSDALTNLPEGEHKTLLGALATYIVTRDK